MGVTACSLCSDTMRELFVYQVHS